MKVAFITLGCKVNQYETQAMENLLAADGHTSSSVEEADAVVINTCAVTGESARKSRQAVRRAKKLNPSAKIVVCGCAAQANEQAARELGADYVGGAGERRAVVDYIESLAEGAALENGTVGDPRDRREIESLPAGAFDGHSRAYLKVQDGCSNFCTYCIIPYLRGPVRSLPLAEAESEAKRLAAEGYLEIVLTGIEVSSYGEDIGSDFAELVERVSKAAKPARVRLGSLEPSRMDEETVKRLAAIDNLCPHFHLSLQSGSGGVLKRMRRKYTPDEYAAVVESLRRHFDDPAITTDLIEGFPGETEEEFEESLAFLRRIGFTAVHVFPYSKREGTAAARMEGHLSNDTKAKRAREASRVANECRREYLDRQVGRTLKVLFEGGGEQGHSENYIEVVAKGEQGKIIPVRITVVREDGSLEGVVADA